jgi:uncharacterized delta-60 repeat protein
MAAVAAIALAALGLFITPPAKAAPGDAASGMGRCGLGDVIDFDIHAYWAAAVTDAQGRTYTTGAIYASDHYPTLVLARVTRAGHLDTTFGTGGVVQPSWAHPGAGAGIALQTVSGTTRVIVTGSTAATKGMVAAFTTTGALDTTFGTNGIASLGDGVIGQGVVVASDQAIYATGTQSSTSILYRFTSAGAPDTGFNLTGKVSDTVGVALTVDSSNRAIVAGGNKVARYATIGALDPTFNSGSAQTFPASGPATVVGAATGVTMQGDAIVVSGSQRHFESDGWREDVWLGRVTSAGAIDSSFGGGTGQVSTSFGDTTRSSAATTTDSSGNVWVAGSSDLDAFIARYTSTGALDTSFGDAGVTFVDFGLSENAVGIGFLNNGVAAITLSALDDVDPSQYDTAHGYLGMVGLQATPVTKSMYVLDGHAGMHPVAVGNNTETPCLGVGAYFGSDIANDARTRPGGQTGYVLDGNGGLHPFAPGDFTPAPPAAHGPYFGFDIARRFVFVNADQGFILDGYGGVHGFHVGAASDPGAATGYPYFQGHDLARDIALVPGGGGYVLDAYGGVHGFSIGGGPKPAAITGAPYFAGNDIARKLVVNADGHGGYVLDGFGGIHRFAIGANPLPPTVTDAPYYGFDIARDLQLFPGGGYELDGYGGVHPFTIGAGPKPAAVSGVPYFAGNDIARAITLDPDPPVTS